MNLYDNEATRKAKIFYNSCMDISKYWCLNYFQWQLLLFLYVSEHIREHKDEPIRQVLAELGGWPVITPNWMAPNFSIERLLGKIRGIYNEGYIIEQWVAADDKNSSVNIIQVNLNYFFSFITISLIST